VLFGVFFRRGVSEAAYGLNHERVVFSFSKV